MDFKIIAVDFDGTLCENKWPEIGEPNLEMIAYLKKRQAAGDKLILWTCRVREILTNAINWSAEHGIIFDAVNENLPEVLEWMGGDSRKIFADEYIDDRNAWYPKKDCKNIELAARLCQVGDRTGYFHAWEHYSKPIEASPLIGGAPAGVFSCIFAIVEFADRVERVDPTMVHFSDETNGILQVMNKEEKPV